MSEPIKMLAEFIDSEPKQFGDTTVYRIKYKQPNGVKPDKVWDHSTVPDTEMSNEMMDMLMDANAGDRFCFHQGKNEKGFPTIVNITDAKDAPAKSEQKSKWNGKGGGSDPYGPTVGNAWKCAIEIVAKGLNFDDVAKIAALIGPSMIDQTKELRQKYKTSDDQSSGDNKEEKPLSKMEQRRLEREAAKNNKVESKEKEEPKPVPELQVPPTLKADPKFFGKEGE